MFCQNINFLICFLLFLSVFSAWIYTDLNILRLFAVRFIKINFSAFFFLLRKSPQFWKHVIYLLSGHQVTIIFWSRIFWNHSRQCEPCFIKYRVYVRREFEKISFWIYFQTNIETGDALNQFIEQFSIIILKLFCKLSIWGLFCRMAYFMLGMEFYFYNITTFRTYIKIWYALNNLKKF